MREIVLDTETTGFEPSEGHRLVEIGCIELTNKVATGRTFHEYINPERDMPEAAFNVHGLSSEFLSDKPLFRDIADAFLEFVGEAPLVIHNAQFDMKFLNWELTAIGKSPLPPEQAIDTLDIARRKFPGAQNSLDALCRRFNIDNSNRVKHGALLDSELLAEVYLDLVGGRQPNLGLLGEEKAASGGVVRHTRRPQRPAPLASLITADEQAAHDEFIDGLGGTPLWRAATSQG